MKLRKWITKRYAYLTMFRWVTLRLYGHKVILFCTEVECGLAMLRKGLTKYRIYVAAGTLHSHTYNGRPIETRI